jgi:superfamily II DNA or RNA helicase
MLIEFDNTVALIKPEDDDELKMYAQVRDGVKTMAPGARYMRQHKLWLQTKGARGWDGRTSILSKAHPSNGSAFFPTGLLPYIHTKLAELVVLPFTFNDLRHTPPVPSYNYTVPLFDFQAIVFLDAVDNRVFMGTTAGYHWPQGVLQIATGGGKTELAVAMCQAIPVPTMFIVHRKHLVTQAKARFAKYGITAGQIGDGVFDPNTSGVTIATTQTLDRLFKEGDNEKIKQFLGAEQIFFDEAHLAASKIAVGNQLVSVSRQFRRAYYRWGLTGTAFMKDKYSNQLLMGCTGDRLAHITSDQLIKAGYLTPPRVVMINMPDIGRPKSWPEVFDHAIVLNLNRNKRIIEELDKCPKPALVMSSRLSHASILRRMAINKGISVPSVHCGATKNKDRTKGITDLQSGKINAIIATTIYDEGLDIPELRTLILAGGGKSKVAALQKIGRGLRKAAGKHEVLIIDFCDQTGAILKRHSAARKKIWEEENFNVTEED